MPEISVHEARACRDVVLHLRRNFNPSIDSFPERTPPVPAFAGIGLATHKSIKTPCENLVPSMEAVNDFVVHARKEAGLTKSSAEGLARDVKNFRGASFSFGSFSFGRAKENEHKNLPGMFSTPRPDTGSRTLQGSCYPASSGITKENIRNRNARINRYRTCRKFRCTKRVRVGMQSCICTEI